MSNNDQCNETAYLLTNPDVEEAVRRGDFSSGLDHFQTHGKQEGRVWGAKQASNCLKKMKGRVFQSSREEKILFAIDKENL